MNFDAVTIMALVDELNATLAGGRVQDAVEVDPETTGWKSTPTTGGIILASSAHQQFARVHLASEKVRRGAKTVAAGPAAAPLCRGGGSRRSASRSGSAS